jgi:hypothetical protein
MDINSRFRRNVRVFYAWLGSMALLVVGPIVAEQLIMGGTTAGRIGAVAIGLGCWVPWVIVVIGMIRNGDEFSFRVHLVALAFAFMGTMMVLAAIDWLTRAHFIEQPPFAFVWPVGMLLWFIGIMGATRHYQRES